MPGAASGVTTISLPDWLAPWVPPELVQATTQAVAWFGPMLDSLLQAVPALAGGRRGLGVPVGALASAPFTALDDERRIALAPSARVALRGLQQALAALSRGGLADVLHLRLLADMVVDREN